MVCRRSSFLGRRGFRKADCIRNPAVDNRNGTFLRSTPRLFRNANLRATARVVLLASGMLTATASIAQVDTISYSPTLPSSGVPTTLIVDGVNSTSPTGVYSSSFVRSGMTIRLYGCISAFGFSTPSGYRILYPVNILAPGTYAIEYHRATCDSVGGVITIISPYQLTATASMIVTVGIGPEAIPMDSKYLLTLLAFILLAIASRQLTWR